MTDTQELLADYVQSGSEAAFNGLVTRYVDAVYSAALRLVCGDAHRAQDVAQTVFLDLARVARTLPADVKLGGWLHRNTCFVAATLMRGERRRQSRERKAAEMDALQNHADADYSLVAPLLDEAINELEEADRTAILLRFFDQHDFRTIGQALGSSEDAARMRVTRALEKLGGFLKRRGVTTTAASLNVALAANAVQAAPVGMAGMFLTAATLAGTTHGADTTVTAIKSIATTTLQKGVVIATMGVLAGIGIYQARQISRLHDENRTLERQQSPLSEQVKQLQSERDDMMNRQASQADELARADSNKLELLRLRGEVGVLRQQLKNPSQSSGTLSGVNNAKTNLPSVVFESVLVDGQSFEISAKPGEAASVTIPADGERFEIHYKLLNLPSPHQRRFAYQLLGIDSDWTYALTNRVAYYNKLPAGQYPFTVEVVETNGMATVSSATLNITAKYQSKRTAQLTASAQAAFPRDSWAFVGYATPESTLQTWHWAMSKGDIASMSASLAPDVRAKLEKEILSITSDEAEKEFIQKAAGISGYQILGRDTVSEEEIILHISMNGDTNAVPIKMRRVGVEWKIAEPGPS